ncbi:MAG: hypothetical protein FJ291_28090 [Planctomycetes bacterium]|nr:hypothetical protein [Planctomycetota bacterium]
MGAFGFDVSTSAAFIRFPSQLGHLHRPGGSSGLFGRKDNGDGAGTIHEVRIDGRPVAHPLAKAAFSVAADGKVGDRKDEVAPAVKPVVDLQGIPAEKLLPYRLPKLTAAGDGLKAVAHWGGWLQVFDGQGNEKARQRLPQDATAMVWSAGNLVVGLADGQVLALKGR